MGLQRVRHDWVTLKKNVSYHSTTCLNDYWSSINFSWHPCQKSIDINIKVYFWTLNSFPLISMSFDLSIDLYLYASNTLFWLLQIFSNFLEKAMATHSITLAWKTPWMEEPCRLQSMGSLRVGYDWETSLSFFTFVHWRRQWQPTPVFLTGESQGRGSLVGCCLWGPTESDTTEGT